MIPWLRPLPVHLHGLAAMDQYLPVSHPHFTDGRARVCRFVVLCVFDVYTQSKLSLLGLFSVM